ncbi:hypothetical protein [Methylobacterium soli]|uniref:DUF5681 domain-containing protein n=1 Tax=Methylobacterium soli TaxID=553447 RepID=A0A6L3ST59_9HYPH|nr:hypothetical protein [Methylobacterium soli]KAB1075942.1 hypothetical protein F6X53_24240 [Methylobacterium soli]GJE46134.1 hypothetical protein AEGHOMDF_5334 [Methylobacterium soli]
MTTTNRTSRGQFAPGAKGNPAGRPKLTEQEIATRACLKEIDEATPFLVSRAIERAYNGEAELMGPALACLAEIMKARNLEKEERLRNEARLLHEEMLRAATTPAPSTTSH